MTEDEAKTKWCPFSRVASGERGGPTLVGWNRREAESFGHREKIGGENHCIGSVCMAWRKTTENPNPVKSLVAAADLSEEEQKKLFDDKDWDTIDAARNKAKANGYVRAESSGFWFGIALHWQKKDEISRGYCGLAGEP